MSLNTSCVKCQQSYQAKPTTSEDGAWIDKRPLQSRVCNHMPYCMDCFMSMCAIASNDDNRWLSCPLCPEQGEQAFDKHKPLVNEAMCALIALPGGLSHLSPNTNCSQNKLHGELNNTSDSAIPTIQSKTTPLRQPDQVCSPRKQQASQESPRDVSQVASIQQKDGKKKATSNVHHEVADTSASQQLFRVFKNSRPAFGQGDEQTNDEVAARKRFKKSPDKEGNVIKMEEDFVHEEEDWKPAAVDQEQPDCGFPIKKAED